MHDPINYEFSDGDVSKSDYIDCLTKNSQIIIPNLESTKAAYSKSNEVGLFNLFLTYDLRQSVIEWTNAHHARIGTQITCKDDLDAFIGLDMDVSLERNNIKRQLVKQTFHRIHDLQQMFISRQTLRHAIAVQC